MPLLLLLTSAFIDEVNDAKRVSDNVDAARDDDGGGDNDIDVVCGDADRCLRRSSLDARRNGMLIARVLLSR